MYYCIKKAAQLPVPHLPTDERIRLGGCLKENALAK
jgi:hypothetical protein